MIRENKKEDYSSQSRLTFNNNVKAINLGKGLAIKRRRVGVLLLYKKYKTICGIRISFWGLNCN